MISLENWKDIPGYEGSYQASDLGRIKSLRRRDRLDRYWIEERILKTTVSRHGYLTLFLSEKDGSQKNQLVHRLIAETHILNPKNKPQVNHKDGIKVHNEKTNLEWSTKSENEKHAYKTGLKEGIKGEQHVFSKLTEKDVIQIRTSKLGSRDLSKMYNVSQSLICNIKSRKGWKHL